MTTAARELIIWRGSQFSNKAIVALHCKGFSPTKDYHVSSAPLGLEARKGLLPPPHTVPVLRWDGEVVAGTDNICAFLDERIEPSPLYPPTSAAEVRRLESACADLYWVNGWLSIADPDGFERWSGAKARSFVASGGAGTAAKLAQMSLPRKFMGKVIHNVARRDFVAMLRRRGAALGGDKGAVCERLANERDASVVMREARGMLGALDAELQASASPFFCGAPAPTAADATLYGMLERWLGDGLNPGSNGAAQPTIIDGMPGLGRAWDEMQKRFRPACLLHELKDYQDITQPVGEPTWPKPKSL